MNSFDAWDTGLSPWETGRPQSAVIELVELDLFRGRVLDVSCGTGDNALYLAAHGLDVVAIDGSPRSIERARAKGYGRARAPRWLLADALRLPTLRASFDSALDCGFLHTLTDEGRAVYLRSLAGVLLPGAWFHVICLSDEERADWGGPRHLGREELAELGAGFFLEDVAAARLEHARMGGCAAAWRATYVFGGGGPTTLQ